MAHRIPVAAFLIAFASGCLAQASATADLDCDGKQDKATLEQTASKVEIRVAFAARSRPVAKFIFAVSAGQQAAVCTVPVQLDVESLDYDPTKAVGPIPGFMQSKNCKGLVLSDNHCDPIHFFWNHKSKRLEWWRA